MIRFTEALIVLACNWHLQFPVKHFPQQGNSIAGGENIETQQDMIPRNRLLPHPPCAPRMPY